MEYILKQSAVRDLKKLPKLIQSRIIKKLDFFINSNSPLSFAEHLSYVTFGEFRFRIGDYRVVFDAKGRFIVILAVGHRRDIYKQK